MKKRNDSNLPKIVYTKLGKEIPTHKKDCKTPFGIWCGNGKIKIDPRQDAYEMLDTIIHESMHEAQPEINEEGIERISNLISAILWREGYRKTDIK